MKLGDKIAIITGAGRGIGETIARSFAKEGAKLALVSRTLSEIESTANKVRAMGGEALTFKADISKPAEVNDLVDQTINEFGVIDILVNNAGIQGPIGPLVENDIEDWVKTIHINLIGQFLCAKAVLPTMMERKQGKIINLSGGGSTSARPNFSAYAVSKAGVVRLTETLAEEVKDYNIQVNAIAPGAVNTQMWNQIINAQEKAGKKAIAELQNLRQTGGTPPEKAASLAVFLASNESDGITGKLISAVHDDWQDWPKWADELTSTGLFTLRRIDPFTIRKLDPDWTLPWEQ